MFVARIRPPGKDKVHVGSFTVEGHGSPAAAERAAAEAYDAKARELLGEGALTNFTPGGQRNVGVGEKSVQYRGVSIHRQSGE